MVACSIAPVKANQTPLPATMGYTWGLVFIQKAIYADFSMWRFSAGNSRKCYQAGVLIRWLPQIPVNTCVRHLEWPMMCQNVPRYPCMNYHCHLGTGLGRIPYV